MKAKALPTSPLRDVYQIITRKMKAKSIVNVILLWSWRESNPRPNEETIRFLHAYLGFDFRATARPKPPTATLSPESHPDIGACLNYSRFTCAADSRRFGTTSLERRLVPSPGDGIKLKIYYTSIKQRERNCFRQLI